MSLLGQPEGPQLEFKGSAVVDDLAKSRVGAAVVAFLNAGGGDLYIGVREENGTAVAIEPLRDAEAARRRVYDHLISTIEPPVATTEVAVELHDEQGQQVLRVRCKPNRAKQPYAYVTTHGRFYVTRLDARTRVMTREEIQSAYRASASGQDPQEEPRNQAVSALARVREEAASRRPPVVWIGIVPYADVGLDVLSPATRRLLTEDAASEQRPGGWTVVNGYAQVKTYRGKKIRAGAPGEYTFLTVRQGGALSFEAPTERLHWQGPDDRIWPLVVSELPVSLFRVAAKLYEGRGDGWAVSQLSIFGARGWKLAGGDLGATPRPFDNPEPFPDDDLTTDPLHMLLEEIRTEPDWCGYRLVKKIYEAFNLGEDKMIPHFDATRRRLILPE